MKLSTLRCLIIWINKSRFNKMECPYCHNDFECGGMVCDNDCATLFCRKCWGEVMLINGEYVKGHDPDCGDESGEFI